MKKRIVKNMVSTRLPIEYGQFTLHLFLEEKNGKEHLALVKNTEENRLFFLSGCTLNVLQEMFSAHAAVTAVPSFRLLYQ